MNTQNKPLDTISVLSCAFQRINVGEDDKTIVHKFTTQNLILSVLSEVVNGKVRCMDLDILEKMDNLSSAYQRLAFQIHKRQGTYNVIDDELLKQYTNVSKVKIEILLEIDNLLGSLCIKKD